MKNIIILIFTIIYFFNSNLYARSNKTASNPDSLIWDQIKPNGFNKSNEPTYDKYKVVGNPSDQKNYLSINEMKYEIPDMLDYGMEDLLIYKKTNDIIVLLGLVDVYASIYFVYYIDNKSLNRLGKLSIYQLSTVEDTGMQDITFKIVSDKNKIIIHQFLGGKDYGAREFELKK